MSAYGMYGTTRKHANQTEREARQRDNVWEQKFAGHTLKDDLAELGLTELPAGVSELMFAWREQVKRTDTPGRDMDALKQARDRLLLAIENGAHGRINQISESACKTCGGSGRIKVGYGQECPTCKGTGHHGTS